MSSGQKRPPSNTTCCAARPPAHLVGRPGQRRADRGGEAGLHARDHRGLQRGSRRPAGIAASRCWRWVQPTRVTMKITMTTGRAGAPCRRTSTTCWKDGCRAARGRRRSESKLCTSLTDRTPSNWSGVRPMRATSSFSWASPAGPMVMVTRPGTGRPAGRPGWPRAAAAWRGRRRPRPARGAGPGRAVRVGRPQRRDVGPGHRRAVVVVGHGEEQRAVGRVHRQRVRRFGVGLKP